MPSFPTIIGRCNAPRDSRKPATTLTLSLTVSGVLRFLHHASGHAAVFTFPETTRTKIWTRVPYTRGADFADLTDGEFFLWSKCCCWPCRSYLQAAAFYFRADGADGFVFPWTRQWTGPSPPPDDSGDAQCILLLHQSEPGTRAFFCHSAAEAGRIGAPIEFRTITTIGDLLAGGTFDAVDLAWDYANSAGQSGSGTVDYLALDVPGPFPDPLQLDTCGDAADFTQTLLYNGTGGYLGNANTFAIEDLLLRAELTLG